MQNTEYIPANFRLSQRASTKLRELTEIASESSGRSMVPALFWSEEYVEIKRENVVLGISWR
jgi:hypothetical protein